MHAKGKVHRLRKYTSLAVVVVLVLPIAFSLSMGNAYNNNEAADLSYVGRDLTTRGDWIGSQYGSCGYALPYVELKSKEVAIGETTGIGESAHEFWWREPWSVPGEKYYPYEDYLGGHFILEYEVIGPEGPPRALVDKDSDYYRPSWYCSDSSITVTLNGIIGDYSLSIYFLDWDAPSGGAHRKVEVNISSSGDWDIAMLGTTFPENFAAGTYAIFEVNSDGTIRINVTRLGGENAVISGIFLDEIIGPVSGVNFIGSDRETKGNWRPSYGNYHYLLPGFNVPVSGVSYEPIVKAYDETNIPSGDYEVSGGVCQYAADVARTYGSYPYIGLYAAYEWALNNTETASDPRMLIYPEDKLYLGYPPTPLNGRVLGVWDSGELNGLLNYFIMKVDIPEGDYIFSIYAADFVQIGRSETIEVWDELMTTLLDSQYITSGEINNGIYVQWFVQGPRTISIKVIADLGNLNSLINGIFVNSLRPRSLHLDAEPPRLVNLTRPVSTQWLELYPNFSRHYYLEGWYDTNRNDLLDSSDFIGLWDQDLEKEVEPYWWYIDEVTVTLKVTNIELNATIYIEFEGGLERMDHVITNPFFSQWREVYPIYCSQYEIQKWKDNCDDVLSPSDEIELQSKCTSESQWYHVDEVKTDLIISSRTTQIVPGLTKENIGQGYCQVIPLTIDDYDPAVTSFNISVYYNMVGVIGNQIITLNPSESATLRFVWLETSTWPKGTYSYIITIIVYADDTLIKTISFPITFEITIIGDVNGDGKVDIHDIATTAEAFGSYYSGHPRYNPNYDVNCDGKIDIRDLAIIARNFGKIDP